MTQDLDAVVKANVKTNYVLRPSTARGLTQTSWLHSRHSFSFGHYHDALHHSFGVLRVINDDVIQANSGFGMHPHQDMEIITYVVRGALTHRDSLGQQGVIPAGDIQQMSAGTGILHSEFNEASEAAHIIQIWIEPDRRGYAPRYQQKPVDAADKHNRWLLLASPDDESGLVHIHQNARLYTAFLSSQQTLSFEVKPKRSVWLQVVNGSVWVNQVYLENGDGLAISEPTHLNLSEAKDVDLLLFDLPELL